MGTREDISIKSLPWGQEHFSVSLDLLSKTPPFPGLGEVGIYIDWCIILLLISNIHGKVHVGR